MPMYEYHCPKCNEDFEEIASADEVVSCPKCGCKETQRLMSACRCFTGAGSSDDGGSPASSGHGGGCSCSGCSGGSCSSCGH